MLKSNQTSLEIIFQIFHPFKMVLQIKKISLNLVLCNQGSQVKECLTSIIYSNRDYSTRGKNKIEKYFRFLKKNHQFVKEVK